MQCNNTILGDRRSPPHDLKKAQSSFEVSNIDPRLNGPAPTPPTSQPLYHDRRQNSSSQAHCSHPPRPYPHVQTTNLGVNERRCSDSSDLSATPSAHLAPHHHRCYSSSAMSTNRSSPQSANSGAHSNNHSPYFNAPLVQRPVPVEHHPPPHSPPSATSALSVASERDRHWPSSKSPYNSSPASAHPSSSHHHHTHSAPSQSLHAATVSQQLPDRYVCPSCAKAFSRPSSLRIHVHSHTGEKPFRCPQPGCGKAFSVRSNMKRHQRGCHVDSRSGPGSATSDDMSMDWRATVRGEARPLPSM